MDSNNTEKFLEICKSCLEHHNEKCHFIKYLYEVVNLSDIKDSTIEMQNLIENDIKDLFASNKSIEYDIYDEKKSEKSIFIIENKAKELFLFISPYLLYKYFNNEKTNMESVNNSIMFYNDTIKNMSRECQEEIENKKKELINIIENIHTEKGLSMFGGTYEDLSSSMAIQKKRWLRATSFLTISAFLLSFYFYKNPPQTNPVLLFDFVYLFSMKLFVLGILVFAISWCAKMYSLTQQQELVNTNKALITKTYNAFIEGSNQEDKKAILAAASSELFALPNTGFVPGKESNLDVLEQTTKIVAALAPKVK